MDPTQPNQWVNPTHGQLCVTYVDKSQKLRQVERVLCTTSQQSSPTHSNSSGCVIKCRRQIVTRPTTIRVLSQKKLKQVPQTEPLRHRCYYCSIGDLVFHRRRRRHYRRRDLHNLLFSVCFATGYVHSGEIKIFHQQCISTEVTPKFKPI